MGAILLSLTLQKRTMYKIYIYICLTFLHRIPKIWRRILHYWFVLNFDPCDKMRVFRNPKLLNLKICVIERIFGWLVLQFFKLNCSRYLFFLLIASFKASNRWYSSFYLFSQWKQVCLDFLLSYWIFWNSMIKVVSFLCRDIVMLLKLGDQHYFGPISSEN